jgi:hypothetical protein
MPVFEKTSVTSREKIDAVAVFRAKKARARILGAFERAAGEFVVLLGVPREKATFFSGAPLLGLGISDLRFARISCDEKTPQKAALSAAEPAKDTAENSAGIGTGSGQTGSGSGKTGAGFGAENGADSGQSDAAMLSSILESIRDLERTVSTRLDFVDAAVAKLDGRVAAVERGLNRR